MSRRLTERWHTVEGLRLFSRVTDMEPANTAIPAVLVHGLGVSSRYMAPLLHEVAPLYRAWAPDLPGFGRSQRTRGVPDVPSLAVWLRKWLAAAGIGRAVFIGNSMGCQILAELAARVDASCVAAAVFLGPTMDDTASGPHAHVFRLLKDQFHEPPSLVPLQAFDYLTNGPIRTFITFLHALRHDTLRAASGIRAPVLLMRGGHDEIVSEPWVARLALAIPDSRRVTIPKAGHALNYNSPAEVTRIVREFVHDAVCR